MASNMRVFVPLVVLLLASVFTKGTQAVECYYLLFVFYPCSAYARERGASQLIACCNALSEIKREAITRADRQTSCYCFKNLLSMAVKPYYLPIYTTLQDACKVDLSYKLDPSPECKSVK